jgi:hypothetical protein
MMTAVIFNDQCSMTKENPMTNDQGGLPLIPRVPMSLDIGFWTFFGHLSLNIRHFPAVSEIAAGRVP